MVLALAVAACGGQTIADAGGAGGTGGTGGTASGGSQDGGGGAPVAGAGGGGLDGSGGIGNGCDLDTVDCDGDGPGCTCPGVFENCARNSVYCEADESGDPRNCVCGEPDIMPEDCDYVLQFRCSAPGAHGWVGTCTCDPVLPTDDDPCRYYQDMYDSLGGGLTCFLSTFELEPEERYKYKCSCS